MTTIESSLEQLAPSDKLAMLHDQVPETLEQVGSNFSSSSSSSSDQEEGEGEQEEKNYTFEPLIAGDFPISIRKQVTPKKEDQNKKKNKKEKLDLSSESAFPSLSSPATSSASAPNAAVSCWSSAASRVKTQTTQPIKSTTIHSSTSNVKRGVSKANVTQVTDVLEIAGDKQIANHPTKPANFKGNAQIIQEVMGRTNTNIIASTNLSGTSTYLIQGASNDVARAKYELMSNIAIKSS